MKQDWSHIRVGEIVKVYMGAGWLKGILQAKSPSCATVQLDKRLISVYDARNIK